MLLPALVRSGQQEMTLPPPWRPSRLVLVSKALRTGSSVVIIETDAGTAYAKTLGGGLGPSHLVAEMVCSRLARQLGLPTLEHAVLRIGTDEVFELGDGQVCRPGSAFITKKEQVLSWDGAAATIAGTRNVGQIPLLVAMDTIALNPDRVARQATDGSEADHPSARWAPRTPNLDNFMLREIGERRTSVLELIAADFSHAFTAGREFDAGSFGIGARSDTGIYGLHPALVPVIDADGVERAARALRTINRELALAVTDNIPQDWDFREDRRSAMVDLIVARAAELADTLRARLRACGCLRPRPGEQREFGQEDDS